MHAGPHPTTRTISYRVAGADRAADVPHAYDRPSRSAVQPTIYTAKNVVAQAVLRVSY